MTAATDNKSSKPVIREAIVVEGRDDTAAVNRAVEAVTIETHGFGMSVEMWKRLEAAYDSVGLIVLTDPDHAGGKIRRKISKRFPLAKQAFLPEDEATKKGDIGIENASPESIVEALKKAHFTAKEPGFEFTMRDMETAGFSGLEDSKARRTELGRILGIGYANCKTMLKRLNSMGISRKDFEAAVRKIDKI